MKQLSVDLLNEWRQVSFCIPDHDVATGGDSCGLGPANVKRQGIVLANKWYLPIKFLWRMIDKSTDGDVVDVADDADRDPKYDKSIVSY